MVFPLLINGKQTLQKDRGNIPLETFINFSVLESIVSRSVILKRILPWGGPFEKFQNSAKLKSQIADEKELQVQRGAGK